jgi:hypothetical protein
LAGLDLLAHFEGQFDGGRSDLLGNQKADGFVDGRPGDRLTGVGSAIIMGAITDIPSFQSATAGGVANAEMSAASPTYGAALQKRRAFPWD